MDNIVKIWEFVKENHKKLNNCEKHDFVDITPSRKMGKKYRCKNCKGELDSINVDYYERGFEHGSKHKKGRK